MKKKIGLLLIGVLIISVIGWIYARTAHSFRVVKLEDGVGVIIPAEVASKNIPLLHQNSRPSPNIKSITGFWTPSVSDVEALEKSLPEYLKKNDIQLAFPPDFHTEPPVNLGNYIRYYWGISYPDKKIVYLDLSCYDQKKETWAIYIYKPPTPIFDGGRCHFGVEFNIKTSTFSNLEFNGNG